VKEAVDHGMPVRQIVQRQCQLIEPRDQNAAISGGAAYVINEKLIINNHT